ncbi:MAG: RsmE family RNA methyltransferase [Pirellulaceae bacterium]
MQRYYSPNLIGDETVVLVDEEAHHAAHVMRVKPGNRLLLFDGDTHEAEATVESVTRKEVVCRIDSVAEVDREAKRLIVVAVALPKGDRARSVIEKAVELGAWGLIPVVCKHSVVVPGEGLAKRLQRYVIDASKQCGRNRLMRLGSSIRFSDLVTTNVSDLFPGSDLDSATSWTRMVAHPSGATMPTDDSRPLIVAVGPEGGFDDQEIQQAIEANWDCVQLGPRILRVETAVGAILTINAL